MLCQDSHILDRVKQNKKQQPVYLSNLVLDDGEKFFYFINVFGFLLTEMCLKIYKVLFAQEKRPRLKGDGIKWIINEEDEGG